MGIRVFHQWAMLAALLFVMGCGTATEPVNMVCPMMGDPIDEEFTRNWNGDKVAFCCKDCPATWDSLSDAEKTEKLKEAQSKSKDGQSNEPGDDQDAAHQDGDGISTS